MSRVPGDDLRSNSSGNGGDPQVGIRDEVSRRLKPRLEAAEEPRARGRDRQHLERPEELDHQLPIGRGIEIALMVIFMATPYGHTTIMQPFWLP